MPRTQSLNEQQRIGSYSYQLYLLYSEVIYYSLTLEGLPKAAVVTHERVWASSFIQAACGVTAEDIIYINLPLYHSAGFLIGTIGAIERGNDPLNPPQYKNKSIYTPGLDTLEQIKIKAV